MRKAVQAKIRDVLEARVCHSKTLHVAIEGQVPLCNSFIVAYTFYRLDVLNVAFLQSHIGHLGNDQSGQAWRHWNRVWRRWLRPVKLYWSDIGNG